MAIAALAKLRQPVLPRRAFTLVELLVVLGIIGLLAGLLLPLLSRSQRVARGVKCVGHLRQLGLAVQMYWDDNGGQAFRYQRSATDAGHLYWFGWFQPGQEGQRAFDITAGALYSYIGGRGVEICPSLAYRLQTFKLKAQGAAYGYGYNLSLSAPASQPPVNISRIRNPSQTAVFADTAQVNTIQAPASPDHPMLEEFYYFSTLESTVHFRHEGEANLAFTDGHVGREKPLPPSLETRLPPEIIGRVRDEIIVVP
jgi:prepilin-type N-terminal cleavage/methylation domain-containing protein/prepilin-type processing-associated H-X9-DG protein